MDDIIGIILLVITIIVSFACCGDDVIICDMWIIDWRQEKRFKKFQNGLSKKDWKDGI